MAYNACYETDVKSSRQKVFAALMDFGGIDKLLPAGAVTSISCEGKGVGAIRTIQLGEPSGYPGEVVERLDLAYDEKLFAYSILGTPSLPIDEYVAVVELSDNADGGCHVKWCSNWVPTNGMSEADMRPVLEGLYGTLIANF